MGKTHVVLRRKIIPEIQLRFRLYRNSIGYRLYLPEVAAVFVRFGKSPGGPMWNFDISYKLVPKMTLAGDGGGSVLALAS